MALVLQPASYFRAIVDRTFGEPDGHARVAIQIVGAKMGGQSRRLEATESPKRRLESHRYQILANLRSVPTVNIPNVPPYSLARRTPERRSLAAEARTIPVFEKSVFPSLFSRRSP